MRIVCVTGTPNKKEGRKTPDCHDFICGESCVMEIWASSFHNCRWDSPGIAFFPASLRDGDAAENERDDRGRLLFIFLKDNDDDEEKTERVYMRWLIRRPEGNREKNEREKKEEESLEGKKK